MKPYKGLDFTTQMSWSIKSNTENQCNPQTKQLMNPWASTEHSEILIIFTHIVTHMLLVIDSSWWSIYQVGTGALHCSQEGDMLLHDIWKNKAKQGGHHHSCNAQVHVEKGANASASAASLHQYIAGVDSKLVRQFVQKMDPVQDQDNSETTASPVCFTL